MSNKVKLPAEYLPLLEHWRSGRKYLEYLLIGGRSSGKSHSAALCVAISATEQRLRCALIRESENKIAESMKTLLSNKFDELGVSSEWVETKKGFRSTNNGSEIILVGVNQNPKSVKGLEDIDLAVIEEAESVSYAALEQLIPTLRKDGSQIVYIWNRSTPSAPIEILVKQMADEDSLIIESTYLTNAFCPERIIKLANRVKARDYELYRHIYLGQFQTNSEISVFKGKFSVLQFEPQDSWEPLLGFDFGSRDPNVLVEAYISDCGEKLYVRRSDYNVSDNINSIMTLLDGNPLVKDYVTYADSSRPELIKYANQNGYILFRSVTKTTIDSGVKFIKNFDLIVHPDAELLLSNLSEYKFKINSRTQEITNKYEEDRNCDAIDALRYALSKVMKNYGTGSREIFVGTSCKNYKARGFDPNK